MQSRDDPWKKIVLSSGRRVCRRQQTITRTRLRLARNLTRIRDSIQSRRTQTTPTRTITCKCYGSVDGKECRMDLQNNMHHVTMD
eukprot:scaffold2215_cov162-Amphora_coffeaeformis.AAC.4